MGAIHYIHSFTHSLTHSYSSTQSTENLQTHEQTDTQSLDNSMKNEFRQSFTPSPPSASSVILLQRINRTRIAASWSNLLSSDIQFEVELRLRLISSNSSDKLRLKCQPVVNIPFYFMYAHERTTNDTSWISRSLNDVTNMNASNAAEIWYLWCSPIACMDKICI